MNSQVAPTHISHVTVMRVRLFGPQARGLHYDHRAKWNINHFDLKLTGAGRQLPKIHPLVIMDIQNTPDVVHIITRTFPVADKQLVSGANADKSKCATIHTASAPLHFKQLHTSQRSTSLV
jgi:hypothetical protein